MARKIGDRFPMRQWDFNADMNSDGAVTISDLWLWGKWLYFYPGDLLFAQLIGHSVSPFPRDRRRLIRRSRVLSHIKRRVVTRRVGVPFVSVSASGRGLDR